MLSAPNQSAEGFADVPEAEQFLSLGRATIYRMMDDGELPYVSIKRRRRIPRVALRLYAEKLIAEAAGRSHGQ